jgi:hypothetical protein
VTAATAMEAAIATPLGRSRTSAENEYHGTRRDDGEEKINVEKRVRVWGVKVAVAIVRFSVLTTKLLTSGIEPETTRLKV